MYSILILIAVAIIIILGAVAAYYLIKLRKAKEQQSIHAQQNQQAWTKHQAEMASDMRFIANAMLQQQCEITEGCLRLVV